MKKPVELLVFHSTNKLPVILQTEMSECAVACLAMISNYYGHEIDLNSIRRRYSLSLKGTTLKDLVSFANQLNFSTRAVKLDLPHINKLNVPAILHWNMNHFVVLKKVTKHHIVIHDPASGERKFTYDEASKHFTGVALELIPTSSFVKKKEKQTFRLTDLWHKAAGIKRSVIQVLLLSGLLQIFTLLSPFYIQLSIDHVMISEDYQLLNILAFSFTFLVFFRIGVETLRSKVILYFSNQMNVQMAANLFQHLLGLPMSYFEKRHMGDIISRFGSMDYIKSLITHGLVEVLLDSVMAVSTVIMLFYYNRLLLFIVIVSVFIYAMVRILMYKDFIQKTEESIITGAKENSNFMETIRGIQSIKLFKREGLRQSLWHNNYANWINSEIKLEKLRITYSAIHNSLFGLENIIVVYIGISSVISNEMSIGMLLAFLAYKAQFTDKMKNLINKFIEFKSVSLHLNRISDIALTPKEVCDGTPYNISKKPNYDLSLINLSFKYDNEYVFKNITHTFTYGESIAIKGTSGVGKTTLIKVILGLLRPTDGSIKLGDLDMDNIGLSNYREHLSAVMQDDQLLSGSIVDNISFFDQEVDFEKVTKCANMACIDTFIDTLPMGYNSLIGDMGTTLSGGQKQRVLLARALYSEPKILVLDEATSHLDMNIEHIVNENIKKLKITRIIIAHRPETINSADKVIELIGGQLI